MASNELAPRGDKRGGVIPSFRGDGHQPAAVDAGQFPATRDERNGLPARSVDLLTTKRRVVEMPRTAGSAHEATKDTGVQIIGGDPGDPAEIGRALTAAVLDDIREGKVVVAIDLSGNRQTDELVKAAGVEGHPLIIAEASPREMIAEHSDPGSAASVLLGPRPGEKADPGTRQRYQTQKDTATAIFIALREGALQDALKDEVLSEEALRDIPTSLGQFYNAISDILGTPSTGNKYDELSQNQVREVRSYFSSPVLKQKEGTLVDLQDRARSLLVADLQEPPQAYNFPPGATSKDARLLSYTVTGHSADDHVLIQDTLIAHIKAKIAGPGPHPKPDVLVVAEGNQLNEDDLLTFQGNSRKLVTSFGRINDSATAVLGGSNVVGTLGRLPGGAAEKVSQVLNRKKVRKETGAEHVSANRSAGGGKGRKDRGVSVSRDKNVTSEVIPVAGPEVINTVAPGTMTLIHGDRVLFEVPLFSHRHLDRAQVARAANDLILAGGVPEQMDRPAITSGNGASNGSAGGENLLVYQAADRIAGLANGFKRLGRRQRPI